MFDDPLANAQAGPQVLPNPSPEQVSDLSGQWKNWLANENNRAAMMQFGISLMQPMGFGQNVAGHVGQAIGSTGELASRRQAADMKQQELDSKAELRGAQAAAAEARAARAGETTARQSDRLAFQRERLDADLRNASTRLRLSALLRYQQARKAHEDQQLLEPPDRRTPFPSLEQWAQQYGLGDVTGTRAPTDDGTGAPAVSSAAPASQPTAPAVGEVRRGYRFKGGNPRDKANWEPVR